MKKIISLFLTTVLLCSVLSLNIFAEKEGNSDFAFAATLGFIDGENFLSDDVVTRIQLAEIYHNIVFANGNNENNYYGETDFPDVSAEKKHIVATVLGMGVMSGYGDGVFAPSDSVTFNQLVKTMVSFLGYDLQAQMIGGYPSGYLTQAARLGILPERNIPGDSLVTFGAVATMLKKAVGVKFATLDGDGTQVILKNTDYLSYYRNIKVIHGTVTGNYLTNISSNSSATYFTVYIDGEKMQIADTAHGIQSLLGYDVYAYYEDYNNTKTVVYYEKGFNNVLELESGDIASVSKHKITYYNGTDSHDAYFSDMASVIYNGSNLGSYMPEDLNPFINGKLDGTVKLIDTDFDGIYDKIIVTAFSTYVVRDVKNNKIYGYYDISSDINDKVIDISNYRERNIDIRNVLGDPLTPAAIKEGYVINVCRDFGGKIKEIIVSRDSTSGILQEIEKKGSKITSITIGDVPFPVSGAVRRIDSGARLSPGINVKVYFNCEDKVAYIDVDSAFSDGYAAGYLVDAGKEAGLSGKIKTLIFGAAGEIEEFELSGRVNINNSSEDAEKLLTFAGFEGDRVKRQAILYKTNEEGNAITHIIFADSPSNTSEFTDGFYKFPDREGEVYAQVLGTFGSYFAISDNAVIFSVPAEKDRDNLEEYKVGATFADNLSLSRVSAYGTDKAGIEAEILVVSSGDAGKTLEYNAPIFVITKISTTFDKNMNEMIKVEGHYVEGTEYYAGSFLIKKGTLTAGCNGAMPKQGDILRTAHFSDTGECGFVARIFEHETKKIYASPLSSAGNPTDTNIKGGHRMVFGKVYEKSGNMIKLNVDGSSRQEVHNLNGGYYKIIECKKDKEGNFSTGQLSASSCVVDEKFHPGEGSDIFIYSRSGTGIAMFVFN